MILGALGLKGKLILAGVVLVALTGFAWRYEAAITNAAKWATGFAALEQALTDERAAHKATIEEKRAAEQAAIAHQDEIRQLRRQRDALRVDLERQEEGDDELANWGAQPLPDALTGGVQPSPAGDHED